MYLELDYYTSIPPKYTSGPQDITNEIQLSMYILQELYRITIEYRQIDLSKDIETAIQVGQRHGKPFVFIVLAETMYNDNYAFYISDNGVWLTDYVPVKYLKPYQ